MASSQGGQQGGFAPGLQQHQQHHHHVAAVQQHQQHHPGQQQQQHHHGHHHHQQHHPHHPNQIGRLLPPPDQHLPHQLHAPPPHHQQQPPALVAQLPPVGGGVPPPTPAATTAGPATVAQPQQPTTTTTTTPANTGGAAATTTTIGGGVGNNNRGDGNNNNNNNNNNTGGSGGKPRNRSWDENYAELLTYKATHNGSTDVPLTYKNDRILGKWVAHLREHQNQAALSQERRDALNAIGFIWNPHEQKWNEMYARLKEYKASTGHCKVPTNWKNDRKLGKWVMRQREKRKNNLLPDHRLQKLEAIGFVWKIYSEPKTRKSTIIDERWNSRYQELIEYRDTNSHCNVPKDYGPLGKWVQEQRVMHQRKLLKADRKKLLEDIGFIFSYRAQKCQQDWNQMYELLKACSTTTEDGQFKVMGMDTGLSRWVHRQKEAYKTNRLDPGREVLLNKIGFQFPEKLPMVHNIKREAGGGGGGAFGQAQDQGMGVGGMAGLMGVGGAGGAAMMGGLGGVGTSTVGTTDPTAAFRSPLKQPPADTTETEKQIGLRLADSIETIAKYMNLTPAEVSSRLACSNTSTKKEPSSAAASASAPTPALRETPRRKAASAAAKKLKSNSSDDNKNNDTDESKTENDDKKDDDEEAPSSFKGGSSNKKAGSSKTSNKKAGATNVNALGRLLPAIIALQALAKQENTDSIMVDASKQLESHIRQEKGWDPRPSEGNIYHRLLSLAAELGVLLDPTSDRCQSIMTLAEKQLKFIATNYHKKRKQQQEKEKQLKQEEQEEEKKGAEGGGGDTLQAHLGIKQSDGDDKKEEEQGADEPEAKRRKVEMTVII